MSDETENKKIEPTDTYNEDRMSSLKSEIDTEYLAMLGFKNDFGKVYKNFHKHLVVCTALIKEIGDEIRKPKI